MCRKVPERSPIIDDLAAPSSYRPRPPRELKVVVCTVVFHLGKRRGGGEEWGRREEEEERRGEGWKRESTEIEVQTAVVKFDNRCFDFNVIARVIILTLLCGGHQCGIREMAVCSEDMTDKSLVSQKFVFFMFDRAFLCQFFKYKFERDATQSNIKFYLNIEGRAVCALNLFKMSVQREFAVSSRWPALARHFNDVAG